MQAIKYVCLECLAMALVYLTASSFSNLPIRSAAAASSLLNVPGAAAQCDSASFAVPQGSPFRVTPSPGVTGQPRALASGSFFGRPDVASGCACDLAVTVSTGDSASPDFLVLLRGNEDGTFTQMPDISVLEVDENPSLAAVGRFDAAFRDLDSVVVVTNRATGPGTATIFTPRRDPNSGTIRYAPPAAEPTSWATGSRPVAIATGDFNGDDKRDVAIASEGEKSLTILLGSGSGSFERDPVVVTGLGGTPASLAVGRFSGNQRADDIAVGVISEGLASSPGAAVVIVRSRTATTFAADAPIAVGNRGSSRPLVASASLSSPAGLSAPGVFRDLVVTFLDLQVGQSRARVGLLVGHNGGGFTQTAGPTIEADPVRAVVVADFDGDRVVDLALSTGPSDTQGSTRFFQGRAAPANALGFHENPAWRSVSGSIRAGSLVSGPFGFRGSASLPAVGVAAINLSPADTISVHLGNGRGAFVEPTVITTALAAGASLFVKGDFHSSTGDSSLLDLAYVSSNESGQQFLSVLLSNGAGGFDRPLGLPPIRAGVNPQLIAHGTFMSSAAAPNDIAIVDQPAFGPPTLRIFTRRVQPRPGDSEPRPGDFVASTSELQLTGITATAMIPGRFRGADMPVDLALVGGRMLTLLLNDGNGRFTRQEQPTQLPDTAGPVVVSNRLRPQRTLDVLIRSANQNQFAYLVNVGGGQFRVAHDQGGVFAQAGNVTDLLAGDLTGDGLDDVVTFDEDMTLRVFRNRSTDSGDEGFHAPVVTNPLGDRAVRFALPGYVLGDFGDTHPGVAAVVVTRTTPPPGQELQSLAVLKADGNGGFTADATMPPLTTPVTPGGDFTRSSRNRLVFRPATAQPESIGTRRIERGLSGVFRNSELGSGRDNLALVTLVTTESAVPGGCPGLPQLSPMRVCPTVVPDPEVPGHFTTVPPENAPCCHCLDPNIPPEFRCPGRCTEPDEEICATIRQYRSIAVYGNTCAQ